jgi:hypothetical protein
MIELYGFLDPEKLLSATKHQMFERNPDVSKPNDGIKPFESNPVNELPKTKSL